MRGPVKVSFMIPRLQGKQRQRVKLSCGSRRQQERM
ncbi:hypothetical protein SLEP1_g59651 [Rubroshorea leprosula]|uniref:Uncharacterized protein n=1 Tax=Rubroshorea leprosula TaxID=152421 RepID=A0AAV5MVG9_9ROSI|nr:hypothetical protein SLEP1_g59651 [Rubroshorea leprosula]